MNTKSDSEQIEGKPIPPSDVTMEPRLDLSLAPRPQSKPTVRRPNKFTADVQRKVLVALQLGHFLKNAANYAGITDRTLADWVNRGQMAGPDSEDVELELFNFSEKVRQIQASAKMGLIAILWRHARADGKVAIALLEKLFPDDYGKQTKTTVTGTVGHVHTRRADFTDYTDEELEELERLALKAKREQLKDVIDAEIVEK